MPGNGRPSISQLRVSCVSPCVPSSIAWVTPRAKLSQPASASSSGRALITRSLDRRVGMPSFPPWFSRCCRMQAGEVPEDRQIDSCPAAEQLGATGRPLGNNGSGLKVVSRVLRRFLLALCVLVLGAWAALALLEAGSEAGPWRQTLAAAMAVIAVAVAIAVLVRGSRWRALAA